MPESSRPKSSMDSRFRGNDNTITSRQNPLVLELKALRKESTDSQLFLEGPRLIEEAIRSGLPVETLVLTSAAVADLPEKIRSAAGRLVIVSTQVFDVITGLESSPGIAAVATAPVSTWARILKAVPAPVVVLDGIQDPGNAAAIARSAEAAGAAGIVTTKGTARLFSAKALRGAMGSTFRLPCLEHLPVEDIAAELGKAGYSLLGAHGKSRSTAYTEVDWKKPLALILGQEGQGLSAAWKPLLSREVFIPMKDPVESLNVAAAAAVFLFEAARQRSHK